MGSLTSAIRLAAGPPFSVHRSSPDLSNAPSQAATPFYVVGGTRQMPSGGPGRRSRRSRRSARAWARSPCRPRSRRARRTGKLIAKAAVARAVLGGGAYFFLGGSSSKVEPAPAAVAAPAPKPAAPVAAAPAPVALGLRRSPRRPSRPRPSPCALPPIRRAGAQIFDAVAALAAPGTTPLSLTRPRAALLKVRIAKDGYIEVARDVPLDEDPAPRVRARSQRRRRPSPTWRTRRRTIATAAPTKVPRSLSIGLLVPSLFRRAALGVAWAPAPAGAASAPTAPSRLATRTPAVHRAASTNAPHERGAGVASVADVCKPANCGGDNDCTSGANGRCLQEPGPPCRYSCSYDDCTADSDCPGNAPCACRSSGSDTMANICYTASNCRVDADCGPGGFCSPSNLALIIGIGCEWPLRDRLLLPHAQGTAVSTTRTVTAPAGATSTRPPSHGRA